MSESDYYKELALDARHVVQHGTDEEIEEAMQRVETEYNLQEISNSERLKLLSILDYEFAR